MTHVPDDELLSAVLDAEASAAEIAHVHECAACQQRLEQLRGAVTAVAAPVTPVAEAVRDAAIAAALNRDTLVVKSSRSRPRARRGSWLSAAAVLVVALGVGALALSQIGRNGTNTLDSDTALRNDKASESAVAADRAAGGEGSAAGTQLFSAAPGEDLGQVDDISVVSRRSTNDITARDPEFATRTTMAPPCPPEGTDPVLWQATLNYRGTDAVATVRSRGTGTARITEIRARADCALLASQEFEPTTTR